MQPGEVGKALLPSFLFRSFQQQPGSLTDNPHHLLYTWSVIFPFANLRQFKETKQSRALIWGGEETRIPTVTELSEIHVHLQTKLHL